MSVSLMMRRSSPSTLTSVPPYLEMRTLSPFFTVKRVLTSLPSSSLPVPSAMTSASWGFSFRRCRGGRCRRRSFLRWWSASRGRDDRAGDGGSHSWSGFCLLGFAVLVWFGSSARLAVTPRGARLAGRKIFSRDRGLRFSVGGTAGLFLVGSGTMATPLVARSTPSKLSPAPPRRSLLGEEADESAWDLQTAPPASRRGCGAGRNSRCPGRAANRRRAGQALHLRGQGDGALIWFCRPCS
jgi:hypothetical protein